jgi:hypothetical protein
MSRAFYLRGFWSGKPISRSVTVDRGMQTALRLLSSVAKSYAVGGAMRSGYHPGRYWMILGCSLMFSAASILFAGALILQVWIGHGSHGGNILCSALALFSLLLGFLFLTVGTLYRASFDESRDS